MSVVHDIMQHYANSWGTTDYINLLLALRNREHQ